MIARGIFLSSVLVSVGIAAAACFGFGSTPVPLGDAGGDPGRDEGGEAGADAIGDAPAGEETEQEPVDDGGGDRCRTLTPTVTDVAIDASECAESERPTVIVTIEEEAPACGEVTAWSNEVSWIDSSTFEIVPSVEMCSDDWESCPGTVTNTAEVEVDLGPDGVGDTFHVIVGDGVYEFSCSIGPACETVPARLDECFVTDRSYRLFTTDETVAFSIRYSTEYCECSEFGPLVYERVSYSISSGEEDYYYRTILSARVCYADCCEDCGCEDAAASELRLENPGVDAAVEVLFEGTATEVRGFIVDGAYSGSEDCPVIRARVLSVDGLDADYPPDSLIELEAVVDIDPTDPTTCCDWLTPVAWDLIAEDGYIDLFAFQTSCSVCADTPCPDNQRMSVVIPPGMLEPGEYIVISSVAGISFGRLRVM